MWSVVETPSEVHVLPFNDDIVEHELSDECICGPTQELYVRWLVTHHSLDNREKDENG
jgi:hypothetical protein